MSYLGDNYSSIFFTCVARLASYVLLYIQISPTSFHNSGAKEFE